jgi:hypothetical protein
MLAQMEIVELGVGERLAFHFQFLVTFPNLMAKNPFDFSQDLFMVTKW